MEALHQTLLNKETSQQQLIETLEHFSQRFINGIAERAAAGVKSETIQKIFERLLVKLESLQSSVKEGFFQIQELDEKFLVLMFQALRILSREDEGIHNFEEEGPFCVLLTFCNLFPEAKGRVPHSCPVVVEAGKCLVNVIIKLKESLKQRLLAEDFAGRLVAQLKEKSFRMICFPFCRILSHLSAVKDFSTKLQELDALAVLTEIIIEEFAKKDSAESLNNLQEVIKTTFHLTSHLGLLCEIPKQPKLPTDLETIHFHRLVPVIEDILGLTEERYFGVQDAVVNLLLNIPNNTIDLFDPPKMLKSLVRVLDILTKDTKNTDALIPILMVLTTIAEYRPFSRSMLKAAVFPPELLEEKSGGEDIIHPPALSMKTEYLSGRLIPHMTSINLGLKHYVSEFFFFICNESADEFVRLTGFGNAVALLAQRNLLGGFEGIAAGAPTTPQKLPSQQEWEATLERINQRAKDSWPTPQGPPTTSQTTSTTTTTTSTTTSTSTTSSRTSQPVDEEKMEQLAELMEKLEKEGMIKVIRKPGN